MQSIYEFPLYYDILFDWDRSLEAGFYNQLLSQHDQNRQNRVLEVGCGTAQIGLRLAALGWRVTGLDISEAMCEFVRQIALQRKLDLKLHRVDMCDFELARHGAAFCPMSSFRMLQTDEQVLWHLSAMSKVVPRGIYILDLEISEERQASDFDQWTMSRNGEIVSCKGADLIDVNDNGKTLRLNWGAPLRGLGQCSIMV